MQLIGRYGKRRCSSWDSDWVCCVATLGEVSTSIQPIIHPSGWLSLHRSIHPWYLDELIGLPSLGSRPQISSILSISPDEQDDCK